MNIYTKSNHFKLIKNINQYMKGFIIDCFQDRHENCKKWPYKRYKNKLTRS